jgi:CRP/FNR family transcriptional regulator, cyclic AMP receptor protein
MMSGPRSDPRFRPTPFSTGPDTHLPAEILDAVPHRGGAIPPRPGDVGASYVPAEVARPRAAGTAHVLRPGKKWLGRAKKGDVVKKRAKASFEPKIFLAKVGDGKTVSLYKKDKIVFSQGEVADSVFYLQRGKVKLTVVSDRGKEAVVAILGPGHFFGEGCLNGDPRRIATTKAIEECVITRLEKATMIAALHKEPKFSELFMSYLLSRNSRIEEDLIDQLFNSSEKRLARLLLLLANFGKEGSPEPIVGKYSQETLAEMIGTTRSRVSFFMNKFRKLGFIDYNGKLEVHNSLLNVILYDTPEIKTRDGSN